MQTSIPPSGRAVPARRWAADRSGMSAVEFALLAPVLLMLVGAVVDVTRFVWLAPPGVAPRGPRPWKTTLSFSELGADHPGALVEALTEFSSREVNLTRIESRPLRRGLGRYMFFIDLEGAVADPSVGNAIEALRGKAENVRVLGSYPLHTTGVPGA